MRKNNVFSSWNSNIRIDDHPIMPKSKIDECSLDRTLYFFLTFVHTFSLATEIERIQLSDK